MNESPQERQLLYGNWTVAETPRSESQCTLLRVDTVEFQGVGSSILVVVVVVVVVRRR